MAGYNIDFDANTDPLDRKLDRLIAKGRDLDKLLNGMSVGGGRGGPSVPNPRSAGSSVGSVGVLSQTGGVMSSPGNGSGSGALAARAYTTGAGPYGKLEYEQRRLDQLKSSGYGGTALKDQQARVFSAKRVVDRLEKSLSPKQGKTQEELIMDVIMTSRILPGGILSPIVGRAVKAGLMDPKDLASKMTDAGFGADTASKLAPLAVGVARLVLPTLIPIAIGALAVGAVSAFARSAGAGAREFWGAGGQGPEVGQAMSLGGASQANAFGQALNQGNTIGSTWFRQHGLMDFGFWTPDKAGNLVQGMQQLRGAMQRGELTPEQARMIGSSAGLGPDALSQLDASQDTYDRLMGSQTDLGNAAQRAAARNTQNTLDTAQNYAGQGLREAVGNPIDDLNNIFAQNSGPRAGLKAWASLADLVTFGTMRWANPEIFSDDASSGKGGGSSGQKEVVDQLMTLNANVRAMRNETVGGGQRSRGVLPAALGFQQWQGQVESLAMMAGAFSVG